MNKENLIANLEKNKFQVVCCATAQEAVTYMTGALSGKTIGVGGSETIRQMGLCEALSARNRVYASWLASEVTPQMMRSHASAAEVYLSSANAMAETGELVNIDGTGNRIAATAYGHEEVYFIVGANKVTADLESALWRARNIAAPKNAKRLGRKTPCAEKGDRCYDCSSPERICNGFLILARPMNGTKVTVVLVDEELGL